MEKEPRQAIKIPRAAHEQLRELGVIAARHGWSAFDIERDDPPNLTSLIEEAIRLLAERCHAKAAKRTKR